MNKILCGLAAALALGGVIASAQAQAQTLPKTHLKVVGSLGTAAAYKSFEQPFFSTELAKASGGAVTAEIKPFNEMGLKGPEVLRLVKQGVVEYGATIISYMSADDPINEAIDLAGMTTDVATARKVTDAFKPALDRVYREKFGAKLLGMWSNPAQVVFCNGEVKGLADLKGKKVRTSSRTQAEFVGALGGTGVTMAFGEVVPALQNKVVDCAITGTLSGNLAKWYEVSTHVLELPIAWNQIVMTVGLPTWAKTDPKAREFIEKEIAGLEKRIWDDVAFQSKDGLDCNIGADSCKLGTKGKMKLVTTTPADRALLKKVLTETVVPKWAERCSADCVRTWNETVGKSIGVTAKKS